MDEGTYCAWNLNQEKATEQQETTIISDQRSFAAIDLSSIVPMDTKRERAFVPKVQENTTG